MKIHNFPNWMKTLTGFAGVVGASVLINFPALAHLNSNSSVNSEVSGIVAEASPKPKAPAKAAAAPVDIVATAAAAGQFKKLEAALKAADLVKTLEGKGPFTVFAPTDAAFNALPKGTVDNLLKPANKAKLAKILTYHVVSGQVMSASLKSGDVKTVEGSSVKIAVNGKKVTVNGANVTKADIKASNGVIHVINKVLMPADVK
jgi:uncharacterized surface protein with fasciclin (FAS1) repeats